MPAREPDYAAIQSSWIRAYQAKPDFFTVKAELEAAEAAVVDLQQVLDAARPSFKFANAQLYKDFGALQARLGYYREIMDGDPSVFPFVFGALTYGLNVASEYADKAPEGAVDTLRSLKLARERGDMSAAVGMMWVATEAQAGWRQSVWDSWLLAITAGPVAESLIGAGVDADAQVILKDVTGLTRQERRKETFEGVATGLGIVGGLAGLALAFRQWRGRR